MTTPSETDADVFDRELAWLEAVIAQRFARYGGAPATVERDLPPPPSLAGVDGRYAALVRDHGLGQNERLILSLALAPHLAPELLDPFLLKNDATGRRFTEFGGVDGLAHAGFLPTAETALFLIAGSDRRARLQANGLFEPDAVLRRAGIVSLDARHPDEPPAAAALRLSREHLEIVLTGRDYEPRAGDGFPAERVSTPLGWDDLVLDAGPRAQIDLIGAWIRHSSILLDEWGLGSRLKPGYRCLFHGGPGTGKTLTAALLGKHYGLPVYRVDLSRVVSKWIGETEKNLAGLFDQAQHRNWILFFDEAEALFGKRTDAQSANDRAANQQIAYLLQRLEDFPGLIILATNQRGHMDEAFARRFQTSVLFPMPDAPSRQRLWEDMFRTGRFAIAPGVDFAAFAAKHELAGGAIVNVLRHACLQAVTRTPQVVTTADIMSGIRHELQKAGHYLSR